MTVYDIAKEAGVSISTVSRAMNNPNLVAPSTLAKVKAVLEKNNFSPNAMARGLANNTSKTIGILLSDIRNPHFSTAAYTLETMFFNWGYTTFLCNTGTDTSKKKDYIRILAGRKVDGLILLGSVFSDKEIETMITEFLPSTPVLTSNLRLPISNCYSVQVDHEVGMYLAIEHLISRGFRDIHFIKANNSVNTRRKVDSFLRILGTKSLSVNPSHIHETDHGPNGGRSFVQAHLPSLCGRQAFIFMDDYTAVGAVSEFIKNGIKIPEQVAVIGYDNSTYGLCSELQLTTIDTHIERMSSLMAKTLREIFEGRPTGNSLTIFPDLIVRETS